MAVSAPRSDCQSMRGARGEAQANEWPGAMIPAFAAVASRPSASFSSTTVTSWPALARKYAVVTPTTPPPRTRVFTARSCLEQVAGPHRVVGIEEELAEAGEVGGAGDLRKDRAPALDFGLPGDSAREVDPRHPAPRARRPNAHQPRWREERHARAGARAAGGGVDLARAPDQRVRRHAGDVRELVNEDVVHARLAETGNVDPELCVHRLTDRHAPLGDPLRELPPHGDPDVGRFDDREDVADADCDVDRHFAHPVDLDNLRNEHDEGRRPAKRDLADTVAVRARDRLDDTGLRVDDHPGLDALSRHHPGLQGHGRGANRRLTARDVVAASVHEEEPEMSAGRDRLGHHRDQEAPVSSRLEAEPRSQVIVMLPEPAALLADRAPREPPEAAREQPHPDSRRVEVDGRDHPIGPHGHESYRAFLLTSAPASPTLQGPPDQEAEVNTTPAFKQIASGLRFPEGPVAMPDGSVILVEIERRALSRVTPDGKVCVLATLGGGANGAALGP